MEFEYARPIHASRTSRCAPDDIHRLTRACRQTDRARNRRSLNGFQSMQFGCVCDSGMRVMPATAHRFTPAFGTPLAARPPYCKPAVYAELESFPSIGRRAVIRLFGYIFELHNSNASVVSPLDSPVNSQCSARGS